MSASFFYVGQQGRPFDLRYGSDANGDSASGNDLMYIPATSTEVLYTSGTYDNLLGWLQQFPGALDYVGKIVPRNALRAPWSNQLDFRYNVQVRTSGKTRVELTADVINLLNLLNKNWGWQWWGPFPSTSGPVAYSISSTTGQLSYSVAPLTTSQYGGVLTRDDLRSRWQAQFGVRFRF
jgi:hypothetical protein